VGGHGDLVEDVETWAATKDNVTVAGAATPEEVREAMARHDVLIVPSRFDGWNVVVNEAIYAGRGVIVTDEAVSHEMVDVSGAGIVVRARSARRLADAMQRLINDPSLARKWGNRAVQYAPLISPDSVGRYLFESLQAVMTKAPATYGTPPWLQQRDANAQRGSKE
jgi:glycosyltransferase involved in cell wall biosynthesis